MQSMYGVAFIDNGIETVWRYTGAIALPLKYE
jgi:hypothetical protein